MYIKVRDSDPRGREIAQHAFMAQTVYAFVLGTIQGIAYQRSKSILYPVLMHSFSNVLMVGGGYVFTALFS